MKKKLDKINCKNCEKIIPGGIRKCPHCHHENDYQAEWQIRNWIDNVETEHDYMLNVSDYDDGVTGYEGLMMLDPNDYEKLVANINEKFKLNDLFETKKNIRWQITYLDDVTLEMTEVREFTIRKEDIKLNNNSRRVMKRHIFARLIKNGFYQPATWISRTDSIFMVTNGFYELFKN